MWTNNLAICCVFLLLQVKSEELIPMTNMQQKYLRLPDMIMPVSLGTDPRSKCIGKASPDDDLLLYYECRVFPKRTKRHLKAMVLKSANIRSIRRGDTDNFYFLEDLKIEANQFLITIESGAFRNLTELKFLSMAFNENLRTLPEGVFEGLRNLHTLTLVLNGFEKVIDATRSVIPTHLPRLKKLDISQNIFHAVLKEDFASMNNSSVEQIDLILCQLENVHPEAFRPLKNLKYLRLAENNLNSSIVRDVIADMKSVGINLVSLDLTRMGYRRIPPYDLISEIANSSISRLSLSQNQFQLINNDSFPAMPSLEFLDLGENLIVWIESDAFSPKKFPKLRYLYLQFNNIPSVQAVETIIQLEVLNLAWNSKNLAKTSYFELGPITFLKMKNLKEIDLSFNHIVVLTNYCFEGLDSLKSLNLANGSIFMIKSGVFNDTNDLEYLNLENNFLQSNENLTKEQFVGLGNLKELNMNGCHLKQINNEDVFDNIQNLTHLGLRQNDLSSISPRLFKHLLKLKILDLESNQLTSWTTPLFISYSIPLEIVNLQDNKITRLTKSMLVDMQYILTHKSNSTKVNLGHNLFICDCYSMFNLKKWNKVNGTSELLNYFERESSKITCTAPNKWLDKSVYSYIVSSEEETFCSHLYYFESLKYLWLIPVIVVIAILIALCILIFKYRYYMRYWIFMAKWNIGKRNARQSKSAQNFKYDAFVSYSSNDREFVTKMVNNLEKDPPYFKLCIYERDFLVGNFISECVLSCMHDSRFIFLIVSDHFAKSQWCRWETHIAECSRIFDERRKFNTLILIKVGEVEDKNMTPMLNYLLKHKIHLCWEGVDREEMFWKNIRSILQR